ncbi:MAG TPA: DedA family protein [Roseiflexaceae bacterium]|nr:DedA family protein [Roseiflexaceae bacterium]
MDLIRTLIDFFLHLDEYLGVLIRDYGAWTYIILFAIIFCETGLVVTPFLPGDSLLFAAGALAAQYADVLNVAALWALLLVAAVLGDTVNYTLGAYLGERAFTKYPRIFRKEYLEKTHAFYEKYGGKTIILARFVPIVRTFAPFVAGVGKMTYRTFITYNVVGGFVWVTLFIFGGYLFGNVPFIKQNFEIVAVVIVLLSVLPMVYEFLKARKPATPAAPAAQPEVE